MQATQPPQWTDSQGRKWILKISLELADRILESTGLDLIDQEKATGAVIQLLFDPRKLAAVLWILVERRAGELGVTQQDLRSGLDGETIPDVWGAIVEAVIFFSPPKMRDKIREVIEAQMVAVEKGTEAILSIARSDESQQAIDAMIENLKTESQAQFVKTLGS